MASIIRVPRTDDIGEDDHPFVLLHISSTGSKPLDLRLLGTEGETAYVLSLKQTSVHSLRTSNAQCDDKEWERILNAILHQEPTDETNQIEAVASVSKSKSITLTIRKNIEGLTSRLGNVTLRHDESLESSIDTVSWIGLACSAATSLQHTVSTLTTKSTNQSATIQALQKQIEELTSLKETHEIELLTKFRTLLNEKKAKIRDQQRLLAASNVDPQALERITAQRHRTAKASRKGKRKAAADDEDEDTDDGFEAMDVDGTDANVQDVKDDSADDLADTGMQTPSEGEETADEDDDPPIATPARTRNTRGNSKASGGGKGNKAPQKPVEEVEPPRRELPFNQKAKTKAKQPEPAEGGESTASDDDDEL